MAPKYSLYGGFTVADALKAAGEPPDNAQFQQGEPPVIFFSEAPQGCAAVFSTNCGTTPFRFVENPTYERQGHYWWAAKIQLVCDELRRLLPDACRSVEAPQTFWDLYKYFDAYEIYYRGAQNLWNVINTLVFENNYVQEIVEKERRMQAEQHIPLFELLAAEFMTKPEMRTKLSEWDEEKQPDILEALPTSGLQYTFGAYENYPEHFLEAIRVIFRKHHEGLQKDGLLAPSLRSAEDLDLDKMERLGALRRYLDEPAGDPFMDKFEIPNRIPNKINNEIVIVDGTSQTAARRAGCWPNIHSTENPKQREVLQGNGAHELHPGLDVPATDANLSNENRGRAHIAAGPSRTKRCSSAPRIGGDPESILSDPFGNKARVYTRDHHEDGKKLMARENPINPKATSSDTQIATNALQAAMHSPVSHLQQIPPIMSQSWPPIHHQHRSSIASHHGSPSIQHPVLASSPSFVPGPVPSSRLPETRDRGMSQDAFAEQIPKYALSQQYMQGPPPVVQQTQYPGPVYMQPNGGRYTMNTTPPYVQSEMRQHHNAPLTLANGLGSFREDRGNSGTLNASNGKWQHIGSDDIHGPRAIFQKDSIHGQEGYNHRAGQSERKVSNESGRHSSTASTSGGYRRFSNTRPQRYNNHVDPRQATAGNTRTPASLGHSLSEYGCVNAHRLCDTVTKFDPCPCADCSDRDRTIHVSRCKNGALQFGGAMDLLKQHFSQFGKVESVTPVDTNRSAVRIKFANPQSAVAAVHAGPRVRIEGLGDLPFSVNFRTGSQFFIPRNPAHGSSAHRRFTQNAPPEQQVAMSQPPNIGRNNSNAHSQPFQYHAPFPGGRGATSGAMAPAGYNSGVKLNAATECAIDVLDRAATQSGFGKREPERSSYAGFGFGPTVPLQAQQGFASIDSKDIRGTASLQSIYGSQFGGSTQDLVRNIADLTQEFRNSRQASIHGTPTKEPQSGNNAQLAGIPSINAMDNPIQSPEATESTKLDVETGIDYGTVRIRPEKAQYAAIPSDWRRNLTPFHSTNGLGSQTLQAASQSGQVLAANIPDHIFRPTPFTAENSQQMQTRAGDITVKSQPNNREDKMSSGDKNISEHLDTSSHAKRKASEDGDEEAFSQCSSKKKVVKVIQPDGPLPEPQSSQPINDGKQAPPQTGNGKKKKNKNKNKGRQNQDAGLAIPEKSSTTASYETQTFQPAIAASRLPQYPPGLAQEVGLEAAVSHVSEPGYVRTSPTNEKTFNGIEPFPAYRDVMSGPQLAIQSHQSYRIGFAPNQSISSNTSTIVQDYGRRLHTLNPGAQNFIPSPTNISAKSPTFPLDPRTSPTPTPVPPVHGENADDSKDDNAPKVTGKENNGGKANSGTRQGGGKGKPKNGKVWKNDRKSGNTQAPTDRAAVDPKAETPEPSGSKDATTLKTVPAPVDQKAEASKQGAPKDANNELPSAAEAEPKESSNHGSLKGTKVDRQDKGKGKEVSVPEKKLEATTTSKTKPKNGKKTEVKDLERAGSRTNLVSTKAARTTTPSPTVSSSSATSASTKSKQGKSKNRAARKKGVGTHPSAKADVRTGNTTSSKGRIPPSNPTKPLLNSDDFPALPSKPTPAIAPSAPQAVAAVLNPWQRPGWTASVLTSTPAAKSENESREKGSPIPQGERKGG
ncbi:hypothetical protein F4823DRAFT_559380 [Ustulina deusta]|nr:hypothetical protein F4823DRAFT_559380 [Ustulina deusta]